jgi:integrase
MAEAARLGLIDRNPFHGLRLPQGRQGRDWTLIEYQSVLRASQPLFRRLVVFLRFSGARPGEARKARWEHLDLAERRIVLREHKTSHVVEAPRVIHLNDKTLKLLLWLKRHQPDGQPFMFVNRYGNPWTMRAVVQYLAEIRERANLPADLKLHGLRHAFTTQGLINDVQIATMASLLGHTNISTTQRYAHLANKGSHLQAASEQATRTTRRPTQLCREAVAWAFASKPELREANAVELHAYLIKRGWGAWIPANVRTFGQYLTPSRQAREEETV